MAAGDQEERSAIDRIVTAAAEVLRTHVRNADGCCDGCLAWGQLAAFKQCTHVEWAEAVRDRYGRPAT